MEHDEMIDDTTAINDVDINDVFNPDSGWSLIPMGYCGVLCGEFPDVKKPGQSQIQFQMMPHPSGIVGSDALDAPLKQRLAHFMSCQCPSDINFRNSTWDEVTWWVDVRNNYIEIARCFIALNNDHDRLKRGLEPLEDPLHEWLYQQVWRSARMFQILYEVLTERWDMLSRISRELAEHDPKFQFPGDTPYDVFTTILAEISNAEAEQRLKPYFDDQLHLLGNFVTLLWPQLISIRGLSESNCRGLTLQQQGLCEKILRHLRNKDAFCYRFHWIWGTLIQQDPWLGAKFEEYCNLVEERLKAERDFLLNPQEANQLSGDSSTRREPADDESNYDLLKTCLTYFMATQCPADSYLQQCTDDQRERWTRMRSNYCAIARCFIDMDSEQDPLKVSLEDPDNPMDQWDYEQFWVSAKMFHTLYEVITKKWVLLSRVSSKFSTKHEPKFKLLGDTPYDVYTALLSEVSNSEMERYFQLHFRNPAAPFGEFAALLLKQIGRTDELPRPQKWELTPEEAEEVTTKFLENAYDDDAFFSRFHRIWGMLAKKDSWLAEKLEEYKDLVRARLISERDAYFDVDLGHRRPSETWVNGKKHSHKQGDKNEPWRG